MRHQRGNADRPMRSVSDFLARFKNFTPPALVVERAVCGAAQEMCGVVLSEKEVRYRSGVANILCGGARKTEILLHKKEIIAAAQKNAGEILRDIK